MVRAFGYASVVFCVLALVMSPTVLAQTPSSQSDGQTRRVVALEIDGRGEPDPPLKYRFIPSYGDVQPGNAATFYYRAIVLLPRGEDEQYGEKQAAWSSLPLNQFPKDEARAWLRPYAQALEEVARASVRERCDWNLRVRELTGTAPIELLLPELSPLRNLARTLRIRSRLEIAEGRFDDALHTLRCGYQLGVHVGKTEVLVGDLVGLAIAGIMNDSVEDWIQSGGPNLYWALASLPNPLVDMRKSLEQEMNLPLQLFPYLKDPESVDYTAEQWRQVFGEAVKNLSRVSPGNGNDSGDGPPSWRETFAASGMVTRAYADAKKELIAVGMDPKKVEAMPVGQVVAIQAARAYRAIYQQTMKWSMLPYWQSHVQMEAAYKKLRTQGFLGGEGTRREVIPIASILLPATNSALFSVVRVQREVAALQTIEAIRMYVAGSGGKLPSNLEQIVELPTPIDPVTGKLFAFTLDGQSAMLELEPPSTRNHPRFGMKYHLKVTDK